MQQVKCFRDLKIANHDLLKVIHEIKCIHVPKHEVLFRIGERGTTFYIQVSGRSQLFILNQERGVIKQSKKDIEEIIAEKYEQLEELRSENIDSVQIQIRI